MKYIKADLLDDVVSSYDQTKTTIQGRVFQKTVDGEQVLGPPVSKFIDVFSDSGQTPTGTVYCTDNGRLFTLGAAVVSGQYTNVPVLLYDFDLTTGISAYVGRINVSLPNAATTTHTIRSLKVIDTGTTNWKIFLTTSATVTINGGVFLVNKIDKADFVPAAFPTIAMGVASDAKAVYLLQDPSNIGVGQLNITSVGSVLDTASNRLYVHNGVAATHQYYVYDTSIAPTWSEAAVTINDATDVVSHPGHTFNNNDPVIVRNLSGGAGLTNNTNYFVRSVVAGVSYQLSATSGGAVINVTTAGTATVGRAWGTTGSNFIYKTGNLPALSGTLLALDSEDYAVPVAAPLNGGVLNGNPCVFLATTTTLYLGLLSQLTAGAVTWPSLTSSNLLGTVNEITAPTAGLASWSNTLDSAIYTTNTSKFITKKVENNVIASNTGELNNTYYEGFSFDTVRLGLATVVGIDLAAGWLFAAGGTIGQRGIIACDFRSDSLYDYSFAVSKVLPMSNSVLSFMTSYEKLYDETGNILVEYRTSGYGSISGGWTTLTPFTDLSAVSVATDIQFKILFKMQSEGSSTPAQIYELLIGYDSNTSISDNWEFSDDFSDNTVPSRTAFRLKQAYSASVPTLYYRAYDLSNSLLVNHNTVTNAANFEYSTDGGTSWNPLGTIPNTVGTLVRYTFTSPPGVDIRPGLKET